MFAGIFTAQEFAPPRGTKLANGKVLTSSFEISLLAKREKQIPEYAKHNLIFTQPWEN